MLRRSLYGFRAVANCALSLELISGMALDFSG
jgi:hypothetical protein